MQRMICISVEQYNKMMESYDEAMKELRDLRRQLRAIRYGEPGKHRGEADDEN